MHLSEIWNALRMSCRGIAAAVPERSSACRARPRAPLPTDAGLSLAKNLPTFRTLGRRIVTVLLAANGGTFVFGTLIARLLIRKPV